MSLFTDVWQASPVSLCLSLPLPGRLVEPKRTLTSTTRYQHLHMLEQRLHLPSPFIYREDGQAALLRTMGPGSWEDRD